MISSNLLNAENEAHEELLSKTCLSKELAAIAWVSREAYEPRLEVAAGFSSKIWD